MYRELVKLLPHERYVYYSDNANCPYGSKSPQFIRERSRAVTELLASKGADIIVLACNTATSAAIADLRRSFSLPFVGMEPALKPAVEYTDSGVVGVLATRGTLKGSKYLDIKDRFGGAARIVEHEGEGFVEMVESGDYSGAEEKVKASVQPLLDEGADTIVLGCTHYPFLTGYIRKVAGPSVRIIDPAPAVARQVLHLLQERGIAYGQGEGSIELLSSGPGGTLKRIFAGLQ